MQLMQRTSLLVGIYRHPQAYGHANHWELHCETWWNHFRFKCLALHRHAQAIALNRRGAAANYAAVLERIPAAHRDAYIEYAHSSTTYPHWREAAQSRRLWEA
eukprot:3073008-Amphidinium_carterae.1